MRSTQTELGFFFFSSFLNINHRVIHCTWFLLWKTENAQVGMVLTRGSTVISRVQALSVMFLHKQGNSCCHTSILVRNTSKDYVIFLNGTGNDKVIMYFLKLHETQAFIYEVLLMYCLIVWQNIVVTYTKSFSLMNFLLHLSHSIYVL